MSYTNSMEDALFELRGYDEDYEASGEKILEFLNESQAFRSFGDALADLITQKYGGITDDTPKEILKSEAKENGIILPVIPMLQ